MIAVIGYVNVRGIRLVGKIATVLELSILAVVLVMCIVSVRMWHHNPFLPFIPPHKPVFQVFGVGFALGLWLYAGYEQVSSVAEEVENPQRNYPRALAWVVPLSIATYFLPTICVLAALGGWEQWATGYFSEAARTNRRPRARLRDHRRRRRHDLSILNSTVLSDHPNAFGHGARRLLVANSGANPSPLRHSVDCDHAVVSALLPAGHAQRDRN